MKKEQIELPYIEPHYVPHENEPLSYSVVYRGRSGKVQMRWFDTKEEVAEFLAKFGYDELPAPSQAETETELRQKADCAEQNARTAIEQYCEQQRKITALTKQIADAEEKHKRELKKAVKAAKIAAETAVVARVCDALDKAIGLTAYRYTDGIRKAHGVAPKYGFEAADCEV